MDIGLRIKTLREESGYTQNGLAIKAGISQTHLRRVELGQSGITVEHLELICDVLGITLNQFFVDDSENDEFGKIVATLTPKQKQLLLDFLKSL